jgi:nucleotide-binding universal stress UspA family protein
VANEKYLARRRHPVSTFPTKVLLATDGSEEAILAAHTAADLANKTDSELHIVYARPTIMPHHPGYYVGPEVIEGAAEREQKLLDYEAHKLLETQVEQVRSAGGPTAQTHLRIGRVDEEIVATAEELGAGLIVVGSRGQGGMRRALMGSVSDSVVRHAHCPVMVVRGEAVVFPTRILLATDGSEEAKLAASTAAEMAKSTNSELHVVCVEHTPAIFYELPGTVVDPTLQSRLEEGAEEATKTTLEEQVQQIKETGIEVAGAHTREGFPDEEIVGLAGRLSAGLIVIGSRGRGRLRRALLGSVSDSVVRHAHCPDLVVRPEKERSAENEEDFLT